MTAFLIDEMFSPTAATLLREKYGRDAVHVFEVGLRAGDDAQVAAAARARSRAVITQNVVDFAAERDVVLVFVPKKGLAAGGAQAAALAAALDGHTTTLTHTSAHTARARSQPHASTSPGLLAGAQRRCA